MKIKNRMKAQILIKMMKVQFIKYLKEAQNNALHQKTKLYN